jgi:phosphatidylserine/phosphatidylglycerophosphate/cardiolipin synthase-like enzyme
MILIDEKTAIIGSTHLSQVSLDLRREVAIVTEEPGIAAELYDCFESLAINEDSLIRPWSTQPKSSEDEDDEEEE